MIPAREVRVVLVVDDHEAAAHLYRDVFGLEVLMDLEADGGHGVILRLPTATLELADAEHDAVVDRIEVGRALGDRVRIAVQVDDLARAADAVAATGAVPMAEPVDTPWGDRNQRFRGKDGLQLTLFQAP
ncbi:MAG TPA: VOC family protein [Actinomycetota bacterium]|nr:VOC family protein [Actinomycetota bacterium]